MRRHEEQQHRAEIIRQFSRQAIPFAQVPGHSDAMQLLVQLAEVNADDDVLDVACGPGLVACEFARHARRVVGIDITPSMLEQAGNRQRELKIGNVAWVTGEAVPLPFADNSFSQVLTRYSFHHFLEPEKALWEMIRVCRPGGRVLVADVAMDTVKSMEYDRMERLRDSSHVHALTHEEFSAMFHQSGLADCRQSAYGVDIELETQLKASFPRKGDEEALRKMITADIGSDRFGIKVRRVNDRVVYTCPITVFVGRKAS